MKMLIEVAGGCVTNISATQECSIYIIDHDSLKTIPGDEIIPWIRSAMQPDFISWEEGEADTPVFDTCLDEALQEYKEMMPK